MFSAKHDYKQWNILKQSRHGFNVRIIDLKSCSMRHHHRVVVFRSLIKLITADDGGNIVMTIRVDENENGHKFEVQVWLARGQIVATIIFDSNFKFPSSISLVNISDQIVSSRNSIHLFILIVDAVSLYTR